MKDVHGTKNMQKMLEQDRNSESEIHLPASNVEDYSKRSDQLQECVIRSVERGDMQVCLAVQPIEILEERKDNVYCLEVPENSAFAVGPGVIAHNCDAFRYAIHTRRKILWNEVEANALLHPVDEIPLLEAPHHSEDGWMIS